MVHVRGKSIYGHVAPDIVDVRPYGDYPKFSQKGEGQFMLQSAWQLQIGNASFIIASIFWQKTVFEGLAAKFIAGAQE